MNTTTTPEALQMAAVARLVRSGQLAAVDSRGRRLPLRFWVALATIEGK